ncbi:HWE histidine kinase domain-containing protein [Mesorhizobium sp. SB112]|uniref:sensor histidine kinase n=1 Tax=Mesorhizobium sp. SB112 TaxID=3151853 RepID=UPI003264261C
MSHELIVAFPGRRGKAAREISSFDWSGTSLGPIDNWPAVLKTTLALMLRSAFPKALVWGDEKITFHNDAFRPILGSKPSAIGRRFCDVWAEAWDEIGPIADRAMAGEASFFENYPLTINRFGREEQAYFTFCYSPVMDEYGKILGMMDTVVETTETVRAQEMAQVLNSELAHRMRNMMTLVSSIASQTMRSGGASEQLEQVLLQRLRAMASVQDVLKIGHDNEADIQSIISNAIAPHVLKDGRYHADGPKLDLNETKALALSLAINELITNAIKYGALSNDDVTISMSWSNEPGQADGFRFVWEEKGGPPVTPPARTGFGSRLIQRHVAGAFGVEAKITFNPSGVRYEINPTSSLAHRSGAR